jgi:hypothetical protein
MPSIPFYADEADLADVVRWLSDDEEIAFIVSAGPKHWIARHALEGVHFDRIALWHIPSGPLPLVPGRAGRAWQRESWIEDPMRGWKERQTGLDPTVPFFGGGHPGIIWLNAETTGPEGEEIGMSLRMDRESLPAGRVGRPPGHRAMVEEAQRAHSIERGSGPADGATRWARPRDMGAAGCLVAPSVGSDSGDQSLTLRR